MVKHPEAVVMSVVKEFYANMEEHKDFHVFVRGKWVPFDRTTINKHYKLTNINNDRYEHKLQGEVDWETIRTPYVRVLRQGGQ